MVYRGNPAGGLKRLAAECKANIHRIKWAVRKGWPDLGIESFHDRWTKIAGAWTPPTPTVQAANEIADAVQAQAIAVTAIAVVGTWEQSARGQMQALQRTSSALTRLAAKLDDAAEHANFMSYRKVPDIGPDGQIRRDKDGNAIMIWRAYYNAHAMAVAASKIAAAGKDVAVLGKVLTDAINPTQQLDLSTAPDAVVQWFVSNGKGT